MKTKILTACCLTIGILAGRGAGSAQSLGEIARQERAKREREKPAPTKVWTNDNIPHASRIEPAPVSPETAPPAPESPSSTAESAPPATTQPATEDKKHTKDYWQSRFKAARAQLADAEERQHLVEDELSQLQIQQVRELDPAVKQTLDEKVNAKSAEADQARGVTAKAQKALDDLQKEFDASGAPDDWSKTD